MISENAKSADFPKLYNDSFERLMTVGSDAFYNRFYEIFLASSPDVKAAFANTNMAHQIEMLRGSLMQMVSFAANRQGTDYLCRVASRHAQLKIGSELFTAWEDCLLRTVREQDPRYDAMVELAWRVTLAPGLAFMRTYGALCS